MARFGAPYFTSIPSARRVGESRDPVSAASEIGDVIGGECRAVNVDMTLAPVVDVNTNPHNEVIGDRAFGSRSKDVGQIASAFIRGCQAKGVAACAKHWPGHGDSNEDSHDVLPTVRHSYERLRNIEIPPFQDAIAAGVASVLVAHLCVPGMENFRVNNSEKGAGERDGETNKNIPLASCSKAVVGALRDQLGFNGVALVSLAVDETGQLEADPMVSFAGVLNGDADVVAGRIAEAVGDAIDALPRRRRADADLEEAALKALRRALKPLTGRKPICQVHIIRLSD